MRTATIHHERNAFHATVWENDRIVGLRSGSYREAIGFATGQGVPRSRVTLTLAAQAAAASLCFGGAA